MNASARKLTWLIVVTVPAASVSVMLAHPEPVAQAGTDSALKAPDRRRCCCHGTLAGECFDKPGGGCMCGDDTTSPDPVRPLEFLAFAQMPQPRGDKPATVRDEPAGAEKKVTSDAKALGSELRRATLNHQRALKDAYVCCTMPGCVFCQSAGDSCPCGRNLRKGEPVCPECWGGWQAGQGAIPAVRLEGVKIFPKDALKTLYEARAKRVEHAREGPSEKK